MSHRNKILYCLKKNPAKMSESKMQKQSRGCSCDCAHYGPLAKLEGDWVGQGLVVLSLPIFPPSPFGANSESSKETPPNHPCKKDPFRFLVRATKEFFHCEK